MRVLHFALMIGLLAATPVWAAETTASKSAHAGHEHKAPHAGTLVVLGEEFAHLELVLDADSGKLTGYALDGEAENPVRLKQPTIRIRIDRIDNKATSATVELTAVANPLTGESVGDTSEFSGSSPALKNAKAFDGVIQDLTARATNFRNVEFRFPEGNE